ncbi:trypsin-like peptidase domain-containing protein [Pseudonocardia sp. NPDC049154]|uniref:trypsin-like serine peptidase n=1 Tax=Pseudonocardia sp. NPDC049154 TaxID=3155501 RepID=UPI0033F42FD3
MDPSTIVTLRHGTGPQTQRGPANTYHGAPVPTLTKRLTLLGTLQRNGGDMSILDDEIVVATGPHTPVSNQSEVADEVDEELTVPSSAGVDAYQAAAGTGIEDVPGHRPVALSDDLEIAFSLPISHLTDIGEASFGPPPPPEETVHGPDDRTQITNTGVYPWRAIASLLITAADNSMWIGTGWFVGPHTLLTAGHVVHIKNSGVPGRDGWVKSIQVMAGRNGTSLPYGTLTSSSFRSVTGWTGSGDQNFDYGAIILNTDLGSTVGWFGYQVLNDADLTASTVNIAGYPGDKPAGTMWFQANKVASVGPRKVFYDIDTAGGQSGAPVWRLVNGSRYGVAVHAYGGQTTNSGTRVTSPVATNIANWKA